MRVRNPFQFSSTMSSEGILLILESKGRKKIFENARGYVQVGEGYQDLLWYMYMHVRKKAQENENIIYTLKQCEEDMECCYMYASTRKMSPHPFGNTSLAANNNSKALF